MISQQFEKGGQIGWYHEENIAAGYFHTYDAFSVGKSTPRKIHLFLPRDYESSPHSYPVIYLNNGDTVFWPHENKCARVPQMLAELWDSHKVQKLIVVAIRPLNADFEYTHTSIWCDGQEGGGLSHYADFIVNTLKPWIDRNYKTSVDLRHNAVGGMAHGGLAAFYTALTNPTKFGVALCLSPSFWVGLDLVNGRPQKSASRLTDSLLIKSLTSTLRQCQETRPRLWIDWGLKREDGFAEHLIENLTRERCLEMQQLLTTHFGYSLNHNLFTYEDPEGGYSEESWQRRFPLAFKTLFPTERTFCLRDRTQQCDNAIPQLMQNSQSVSVEKTISQFTISQPPSKPLHHHQQQQTQQQQQQQQQQKQPIQSSQFQFSEMKSLVSEIKPTKETITQIASSPPKEHKRKKRKSKKKSQRTRKQNK